MEAVDGVQCASQLDLRQRNLGVSQCHHRGPKKWKRETQARVMEVGRAGQCLVALKMEDQP
jgi:hypothetical protein